jgi:hypothetical protein
MASLVARSAGAVSIARSMEVIFPTNFSKCFSKYGTLEINNLWAFASIGLVVGVGKV